MGNSFLMKKESTTRISVEEACKSKVEVSTRENNKIYGFNQIHMIEVEGGQIEVKDMIISKDIILIKIEDMDAQDGEVIVEESK